MQENDEQAPLPAIITRREVRKRVFQAVFSYFFSEETPKIIFDKQLKPAYVALKQQTKPINIEDDARFLWDLFYKAIEYKEEYLELTRGKLENWSLERVNPTDRALILLGIVEFLHFPDIPPKVTINEYLDIAKRFSTEKSDAFINGVLDKVLQELEAAGDVKKSPRGRM